MPRAQTLRRVHSQFFLAAQDESDGGIGDNEGESMDEYDVDLIDYLRIIWKGKWLILACVIVALATSATVLWTRPDKFSGTASYRLYQSLSVLGISGLDQKELLNTVLYFQSYYEKNTKLALTARTSDGRVAVTLAGPLPPDDLTQAFGRLSVSVNNQLKQYIRREIAQAVVSTSMHIKQLTRQRDTLKTQMDALGSPAPDDPLLGYLAQKTSDLYAQLAQDQVKLEALNTTDPTALFTVETLGEPVVFQIRPNRALSLAVSGVLGVFFGLFLAFFVHYLEDVREREGRAEGKELKSRYVV